MEGVISKAIKTETVPIRLGRYGWALVALWTTFVVTVLLWSLLGHKRKTLETAYHYAVSSFEKDRVYRLWAAAHGGVYVPATEQTPPNPYLSHIVERDIKTPSGRLLTLVNPAYMTRQVHELGSEQYGLRGHITSLNPLRPENSPDPWEAEALRAFEEGMTEMSAVEEIGGESYLRLIRPLVTEKACLKCHAAQGYKLGDIRGGISISVPMASLWNIAYSHMTSDFLSYGLIWILGLCAIVLGTRRLGRSIHDRDRAEEKLRKARDELEIRVRERTAELMETNERLKGEINERKRAEGHLHRETERTKLLLELYLKAPQLTDKDLYDYVLEKTVDLTESNIGFFHQVADDQKTIILTTWNSEALKNCTANYDTHYSMDLAGNWVDCVRLKRQVIYNDFPNSPNRKGLPEGHTPLKRFMSIPVMDGEKVRFIFGVGNKPVDYDEHDVAQLQLVANEMHKIIMRRRAEEELKKSNEQLRKEITERKKLEEQLSQAMKMEAIGRLAGGIAHDFNNILAVILSYSGFIIEELKEDDPMREDAQEIKDAGNRAAALTKQLLAFSRKETIRPEILNLNNVVENLDKMLRRIIGEDIEFKTTLAEDLSNVKADAGQMEQVLANLAVNARDAMPDGGKLTIETQNVDLDEEYVSSHPTAEPGSYVMLAVSDTGCGMEAETLSNIFEPFFTTKEIGKGTGLGLSTVYGIAKQNKGHIFTYSEPGQGTTFKIYLPRIEDAVKATKRDVVPMESLRGSETILLVEDDEPVRKIARRILERQGYKIIDASNGAEALFECERHKGRIHLLLTDVIMPKMSGKEIADKLNKSYPDIKVLYMSGYTDNAIAHHGILDEGVVFIQKPFTKNGLLQKVREALSTLPE